MALRSQLPVMHVSNTEAIPYTINMHHSWHVEIKIYVVTFWYSPLECWVCTFSYEHMLMYANVVLLQILFSCFTILHLYLLISTR